MNVENQITMSRALGDDCCELFIIILSYFLVVIFFPFSLLFCFSVVNEYQRAVIFRFGKLKTRRLQGPGMVFLLRCCDKIKKFDMRLNALKVPVQSVVTSDTVPVEIETVLYYNVSDPVSVCMKVKKTQLAISGIAVTSVRNIVTSKNLQEIIAEREGVSETIKILVSNVTHNWGIMVQRADISDVKIDDELALSMTASAKAAKEAKAKKLSAEAELKVAKALKEASDFMVKNPMCLQLKYVETVGRITMQHKNTMLFPLPLDVFTEKCSEDCVCE